MISSSRPLSSKGRCHGDRTLVLGAARRRRKAKDFPKYLRKAEREQRVESDRR